MTTNTITERTFDISIACNNVAFDSTACGLELARILRKLADDLEREGCVMRGYGDRLYDGNGNHVGIAVPDPARDGLPPLIHAT